MHLVWSVRSPSDVATVPLGAVRGGRALSANRAGLCSGMGYASVGEVWICGGVAPIVYLAPTFKRTVICIDQLPLLGSWMRSYPATLERSLRALWTGTEHCRGGYFDFCQSREAPAPPPRAKGTRCLCAELVSPVRGAPGARCAETGDGRVARRETLRSSDGMRSVCVDCRGLEISVLSQRSTVNRFT